MLDALSLIPALTLSPTRALILTSLLHPYTIKSYTYTHCEGDLRSLGAQHLGAMLDAVSHFVSSAGTAATRLAACTVSHRAQPLQYHTDTLRNYETMTLHYSIILHRHLRELGWHSSSPAGGLHGAQAP